MRKITILGVEVQKVSSDQIVGRRCNVVPGRGPEPNLLLMGAQSGSTAAVAVEASVKPRQIGNIAFVGVRRGSTLLGSQTVNPSGETLVSYSTMGASSEDEVVFGCDLPPDGARTASEVADKSQFRVRAFVPGDMSFSSSALRLLYATVAGGILETFVDGVAPPAAGSPTSKTLPASRGDLTHKVGAVWGASCTAPTDQYTFPRGSTVSDGAADSCVVIQHIRDTLQAHDADIRACLAASTAAIVPCGPWTWSKFSFGFSKVFDPLLFLAFGHVVASGDVRLTVDRAAGFFQSVNFTGSFTDMQDFNYYDPPPISYGATVQMGFGTLSSVGGKVRFYEVDFDKTTASIAGTLGMWAGCGLTPPTY